MEASPAGNKSSARTPRTQALAPPLDPVVLRVAQDLLVAWFEREGRDLPWRQTRDPWRILVAEVMLQQIQVARAIPFWEVFLARFPTPAALAEAPRSAAIRVWGDLGRYRRVVDLHRTARILVDNHSSLVPDDPAVLQTLPGIGPYTAGAIACFAFERDASFVDTNIRRVLHRLFVGADVPPSSASTRAIAVIAERAVPVGQGWFWNQALMDLGATVCTARKPKCDRCPVSATCIARPEIEAALASAGAARRAGSSAPAYRYKGTNRYFRGRVLEQLRAVDPEADEVGLSLTDLGVALRDDFAHEHIPWLRGVVESLERDGLAVADERPAYDPGRTPEEMVVKLPA